MTLNSFLLFFPFISNALEVQTSDNHTRYIFNSNDIEESSLQICSKSIYLPTTSTVSGYVKMNPKSSSPITYNHFYYSNEKFRLNDTMFHMNLVGENNRIISSI